MATATKEPTTDPGATAPESPAAEPAKKKKKARTRKKNRRGQALERGVSSAAETMADAALTGWKDWNRRQKKSARSKRDGAIEDGLRNWSRSASKAWRKSASAPEDFWDGFDSVWTGKYSKVWRLW